MTSLDTAPFHKLRKQMPGWDPQISRDKNGLRIHLMSKLNETSQALSLDELTKLFSSLQSLESYHIDQSLVEECKLAIMRCACNRVASKNQQDALDKKSQALVSKKGALFGFISLSLLVYGLGKGVDTIVPLIDMIPRLPMLLIVGLTAFVAFISVGITVGFELREIRKKMNVNVFKLGKELRRFAKQANYYKHYAKLLNKQLTAPDDEDEKPNTRDITAHQLLLGLFRQDLKAKQTKVAKAKQHKPSSFLNRSIKNTGGILGGGFSTLMGFFWGSGLGLIVAKQAGLLAAGAVAGGMIFSNPLSLAFVVLISFGAIGAFAGLCIFKWQKNKGAKRLVDSLMGKPAASITVLEGLDTDKLYNDVSIRVKNRDEVSTNTDEQIIFYRPANNDQHFENYTPAKEIQLAVKSKSFRRLTRYLPKWNPTYVKDSSSQTRIQSSLTGKSTCYNRWNFTSHEINFYLDELNKLSSQDRLTLDKKQVSWSLRLRYRFRKKFFGASLQHEVEQAKLALVNASAAEQAATKQNQSQEEQPSFNVKKAGLITLISSIFASLLVYGGGRGLKTMIELFSLIPSAPLYIVYAFGFAFAGVSILITIGFEFSDISAALGLNVFSWIPATKLVNTYAKQADAYSNLYQKLCQDLDSINQQEYQKSEALRHNLQFRYQLLLKLVDDMKSKRDALLKRAQPSPKRILAKRFMAFLGGVFNLIMGGFWGSGLGMIASAKFGLIASGFALGTIVANPLSWPALIVISLSILGAVAGLSIFYYQKRHGFNRLVDKCAGYPEQSIKKITELNLEQDKQDVKQRFLSLHKPKIASSQTCSELCRAEHAYKDAAYKQNGKNNKLSFENFSSRLNMFQNSIKNFVEQGVSSSEQRYPAQSHTG